MDLWFFVRAAVCVAIATLAAPANLFGQTPQTSPTSQTDQVSPPAQSPPAQPSPDSQALQTTPAAQSSQVPQMTQAVPPMVSHPTSVTPEIQIAQTSPAPPISQAPLTSPTPEASSAPPIIPSSSPGDATTQPIQVQLPIADLTNPNNSPWPTKGIFALKNLKGPDGVPLGPTPNPWIILEPYQQTMTREEFEHKLHTLYDPFNALPPYLDINDDRVIFYPSPTSRVIPQFVLRFASPTSTPRPAPRWFRSPSEFRAENKTSPEQPLLGLRIAIDPGHIGGPWGQIENRSVRYNGGPPIQEGDLNLITSRLLKAKLQRLGADVFTVRESTEPVTQYRPSDLMALARETLIEKSANPALLRGLSAEDLRTRFPERHLLELAEFLFYRSSEIHERGNRIRNNFVPDVTITLYINATPSSGHGRLVNDDQDIFFVHGCYLRDEIKEPEQRMRCIYKLLEHSSDIEREVAASISNCFIENTHLGPVKYGDSPTTRMVIPGNLFVVARNLVANREYDGPDVCTEPYFMNNKTIYQRILMGDYEGERVIDGKKYKSFFREYADNVAAGLVAAYGPPSLASATDSH